MRRVNGAWLINPGAERRMGVPRTEQERLERHFGQNWATYTPADLPLRGTGLLTGRAAGVVDLRRNRSVFEAPPERSYSGIEWGSVNWPAVGLLAGAAVILGYIVLAK